jgi:hypothetical protein
VPQPFPSDAGAYLARLGRDHSSGDVRRLANQSTTDTQFYYCDVYVFGVELPLSHQAGMGRIEYRHTLIYAILISNLRMKEFIALDAMHNLAKFLDVANSVPQECALCPDKVFTPSRSYGKFTTDVAFLPKFVAPDVMRRTKIMPQPMQRVVARKITQPNIRSSSIIIENNSN